jgi:hypothetical protein
LGLSKIAPGSGEAGLIESNQAHRFIVAYKAVLSEILRESGEVMDKDLVSSLACARAFLKRNPESLGTALAALGVAGVSIPTDVQRALKSLRIERWIYLRSTTRHAIFIDQAVEHAYAVLGLNDPIQDTVGSSAVAFESAIFSFAGHYVCDGIIQNPARLGPGYKAQCNVDLAAISKRGRFHLNPEY